MKIKNSRLELERVYSLSDLPKVMMRKDLRYKTVYAISPKSKHLNLCCSVSFKGSYKLEPTDELILKSFTDYYVITTSGTKESKISYTDTEKQILISIFSGVVSEYRLDTAEILCHAVGNKELLQTFYSDYGKMIHTKFLCDKLCEKRTIPSIKDTDRLFPHQYQRPRYSIYELVQDLIYDKACICTDPDLTGKFEKISRSTKKTSEYVGDSWNPIIGTSFNKTRANINLNYMGTVRVNVPENEVGVEPGERELKTIKSICLVKDGKACNMSFGIRIKSKALSKKLKAAGVIKGELVYPGDYLVDITNLPVISKSKFTCIRSFDLASAEIGYRLSEIAIEYLMRREYKETKKLKVLPDKLDEDKTTDPAKLFLESLGIYGNYFYPDKKVGGVQKVYDTTELLSNIKVIPTKNTCTKNITKILNGLGKYNQFVYDFLNSCVIPDITSGTSYKDLIELWEERKNGYRNIIRDLKFRLISGKSLRVCVHGSRKKSLLEVKELIKFPGISKYEIPVSWYLKDKHVIV